MGTGDRSIIHPMYKNQLQELAQRSCFGLPSYVCTREGPDHAPRFKATVTFNGETFHGPTCCTTLRQAEHAAAEAALALLSLRGPSTSLTATILVRATPRRPSVFFLPSMSLLVCSSVSLLPMHSCVRRMRPGCTRTCCRRRRTGRG